MMQKIRPYPLYLQASYNLRAQKVVEILKKRYRIIISICHGTLLFICLWLLTNSSYTSAADEGILKQVNILEQSIFNNSTRYGKQLVFVNVSRDQQLVSDPNDYGEIAITDRSKLARFFNILADNGNQHHFVLCDIFFENTYENDSVLLAATKRCNHLLFPYHIIADTIHKPAIDVPVALSDFVTYTGNFSKFKLVHKDSLKTTPLVLLETLDKKNYPKSFLDMNSIFPQYYIQASDLFTKKTYPYYNLGELLMLAEVDSFYNDFLKDKFIVIGNYETDVHYSPVGNIPGPLILLNTYFTLRNNAGVSWWWALFMIVGFSSISYILFFKKIKAPDINKGPWVDLALQLFVNKYISFSGISLLLVILSSFIFSVQPNISLLLSYILLFSFCKDFYKKHFKKKEK